MYRNLKGNNNRRIIEEISLTDAYNTTVNGAKNLGNTVSTSAQNAYNGVKNLGNTVSTSTQNAYNGAKNLGNKVLTPGVKKGAKYLGTGAGIAGGLYGAKKLYDSYEDGSLADTMNNTQNAYNAAKGDAQNMYAHIKGDAQNMYNHAQGDAQNMYAHAQDAYNGVPEVQEVPSDDIYDNLRNGLHDAYDSVVG